MMCWDEIESKWNESIDRGRFLKIFSLMKDYDL